MTAAAIDKCDACGAPDTELWSGWFGTDDLASDGRQPGDRWTTWCNRCGAEQTDGEPIRVRQAKAKDAPKLGRDEPKIKAAPQRGKIAPIGEVVYHKVCRETGATITIERTGPGSWVEQEPGWMTFCLNHSTCVLHDGRHVAESHAAKPSGWCGDCARIAEGKAPKITVGKVT